MANKLIVSAAPHITSADSTSKIMGRVCIALLPTLIEMCIRDSIISLRFGLDGAREQTQKEVADRLGISQSYISRLEKRIIARLKKEIVRMM